MRIPSRSVETAVTSAALAMQGPLLGYLARLPAAGQATLASASILFAGGLPLVLRNASPNGAVRRHLSAWALGTLGMLVGWYADAGFRPLVGGAVCLCGCPDSLTGLGLISHWHWMQAGMLAACGAGHLFDRTARSPAGLRALGLAACSASMLAGMALAGWAAGLLRLADPATALVASYAAMATGMLAGPLAGEGLASRARPLLLNLLQRPPAVPLHEPAS